MDYDVGSAGGQEKPSGPVFQHRTALLGSEAMPTTTTTHETVSEAQLADPRDDYIPVGTDKEGAYHVYRTCDESVHVIEDGERTVRYDLEELEKSINDWIDYVDAKRDGFDVQYLYQCLHSTVASTLGGAAQ